MEYNLLTSSNIPYMNVKQNKKRNIISSRTRQKNGNSKLDEKKNAKEAEERRQKKTFPVIGADERLST